MITRRYLLQSSIFGHKAFLGHERPKIVLQQLPHTRAAPCRRRIDSPYAPRHRRTDESRHRGPIPVEIRRRNRRSSVEIRRAFAAPASVLSESSLASPAPPPPRNATKGKERHRIQRGAPAAVRQLRCRVSTRRPKVLARHILDVRPRHPRVRHSRVKARPTRLEAHFSGD